MATTKEIHDFIQTLHLTQLRFIRDMNTEELEYLCNAANNAYEGSFEPVQTNKLRLIGEITNQSTKRERRMEVKLFKLFDYMNEFAAMTDKEIADYTEQNIWASQDIYSRESALVQDIIARLARSDGKELPKLEKEDDISGST